ncbi:MAG: endopeptidase La [Ruminococcaceae bacterium]|nr:endopeptidase La [Oscillospiraceae bacterium]
MNKDDKEKIEVSVENSNTKNLPLVPMRGLVVFPNTVNHFDVGRKKTFGAIEWALSSGSQIFVATQKDVAVEEPTMEDLHTYGVVGEIRQVLRFTDNIAKVLVECKQRAKILQLHDDEEYYTVDIEDAPVEPLKPKDKDKSEALTRSIREQLDIFLDYYPKLSGDIILNAHSNNDPHSFVENLAFNLPFDYLKKQEILDESEVIKRMQLLLAAITHENKILSIERDITERVRGQIDKNQREYYLREQMRAISSELSEDDSQDEIEEYLTKISNLPIEETHKIKLQKEVSRLQGMPGNSQEASVIRTYLDTVIELPWDNYSTDNFDIEHAKEILDKDHFGLDDVKDRMLEFIAVRSLTDSINAQIICLIGPPGVGKTSIAKAVAESMGRKFVRISLGGVRDEAEIRGHRRTYIGSMPGRIISAIQQAGTKNPLILLDEVDKLGSDYRGDPSSALLEVLDPEQNNNFRDHYLDMPFDLSKVLFITTANNRSTIPAPLYDRMDVVEVSSYTRIEKFNIAKKHLLKKQLDRHGVTKKQFRISDAAIMSLIDNYTREAGVRNLERTLAKLIRKSARIIVSKKAETINVTVKNLEDFLGPKIVRSSLASRQNQIGVVNGLAWTSFGGELLPIEASVFRGSGKLELTGRLGEVMKESAKIAISFIRTIPLVYGIPKELLTEYDIHIHAPEGAVPKDGPSAGVTLTTALVSSISGFAARKDVAMTGEITLKGDILPIGGLKEKLIAAYKEKINLVLIPKDNMPDLYDVPEEVKSGLRIEPVTNMIEVLKKSLIVPEKQSKKDNEPSPEIE